nr:hypothetical protein [Bacteroidota bacterium]
TEFFIGKIQRYKITYKYDNNNNLIEEIYYEQHTSEFKDKEVNKYNDMDLIIEQSTFNSSGKIKEMIIFKYDMSKKLIEKNRYNSRGSLTKKWLYKYDKNGQKIEEVALDYFSYSDEPVIINKYIIEWSNDYLVRVISEFNQGNFIGRYLLRWDKNDNVVESNDFGYDEIMDNGYAYKYDIYGNRIEHAEFNEERKITHFMHYEYIYDDVNNWIRKIHYINTIPKYIIEREIMYY